MRAANWKSGQFGIEFNKEETEKLGGIGAPIAVHMLTAGFPSDSLTSSGASEPAMFYVERDEGSTIHISKLSEVNPKTGSIGIIRFNGNQFKGLPDFGMHLVEVDWVSRSNKFIFSVNRSNLKPARNRKSKTEPTYENRCTIENLIDWQPKNPETIFSAEWQQSLRAAIQSVNELCAQHKDKISLMIEDGVLRARIVTEF